MYSKEMIYTSLYILFYFMEILKSENNHSNISYSLFFKLKVNFSNMSALSRIIFEMY